MSLGHDLHTGILLFHTAEYPSEELDFGDFARAQEGRTTTRDGV